MIELGELRHGDEPEPPPQPRRPPTASARLAALCCAVLLTLAGAAPVPDQPSGVSVPAPRNANFLVLADRLVTAGGPGTADPGDRLVSGYRLPDGAPVWRFSLPVGDELFGLWTVADLVLVASNPAGFPGDVRTVALDPRTGATRWRQPGHPTPTQAGGVIFDSPGTDGTGVLRAVDPATGKLRWSLPLAGKGPMYGYGSRGVTALVLVGGDGLVEVYDVDSGALRRAGRLPPAVDRAYRLTHVLGDLLLVGDASGTAAAYGLDRLDRRWTLPWQPAGDTWFTDCAEVVCLSGRSAGLRAYDAATGRPRWHADRWRDAIPVDGRLLVAPDDWRAEDLAVLDAGTGRTLARLGRWRLADFVPNRSRPLGSRPVSGGRTLVAELDVPAGQVRMLAVLPGFWSECATAAAVLVCKQPAGGLVIWPLER
ncbi:outer membrane protein assembly factor BamB family protein [Micromonospora narathiwatensis]|uniref:Outer membrane protein assembly factor BamB, contains PQQ-like beta-propeller repeat n=1 Tax=Micromonospora narathiwatensis TaxID=299146 RepID=A0A1A8Z3Q6_9ACTN|nr:PQQ-binding-like beta-propeller repeat protein [Micromonospora narathiwatensis]SBT38464.1 Outer membrane protein assembly factor BamB, contains PQQ-like beta-propeller repeat [Micromonospora narathiwatensis]